MACLRCSSESIEISRLLPLIVEILHTSALAPSSSRRAIDSKYPKNILHLQMVFSTTMLDYLTIPSIFGKTASWSSLPHLLKVQTAGALRPHLLRKPDQKFMNSKKHNHWPQGRLGNLIHHPAHPLGALGWGLQCHHQNFTYNNIERKLVTLTVHEKLMQQKSVLPTRQNQLPIWGAAKKSSPNPLGFPGNQPLKEWLRSDGQPSKWGTCPWVLETPSSAAHSHPPSNSHPDLKFLEARK